MCILTCFSLQKIQSNAKHYIYIQVFKLNILTLNSCTDIQQVNFGITDVQRLHN